jgi:hypothetical protein
MSLVLLVFCFLADEAPRKARSYAPSLPAVTQEEEDRFDDIVRRFTQADIGRLTGAAARKANKEFDSLGPSAIPALLRGLNAAAKIKHSCPVLMLTKKLNRLLSSSQDPVLLEFARDELQAGANSAPHGRTVSDLRVKLMLRRNSLERLPPPPASYYEKVQTDGLVRLVNLEKGKRKVAALKALAGREGREAMLAISRQAFSRDPTLSKVARELLEENLGKQSKSLLRESMVDTNAEVRKAAVRVAVKDREMIWAVIDRVTDERADVREQAHQALVKFSKGEDFGPTTRSSKLEQTEARKKWRAWWEKNYTSE